MKKLTNKKGFTLAELLIVVAIVAVLVAISIPIFSGKLLKAKIATNQANIRAAKAAAVADYLTSTETTSEKDYYYNISKGVLDDSNKTVSETNGVYQVIAVKIKGDDVTTKPYVTNNVSSAKALDEAICGNDYGKNGDAAKQKQAPTPGH